MILDFVLIHVVISVLVIFYEVLLDKGARFNFNRYFLIAIPVVALCSLLVPEISLSAGVASSSNALLPHLSFSLPEVIVSSDGDFGVGYVFVGLYALVGSLIFFRCVVKLSQNLKANKKELKVIEGYRVYSCSGSTHSFLNSIFINPTDEQQPLIIEHELEHLKQRHWIDLIWAQFIVAVFWINPLVWRWNKLIRRNHEYLADAKVAKGVDFGKTDYIHLLLDKAFDTNHFSMQNYFSMKSLISKRIAMLNTRKKYGTFRMMFSMAAIFGATALLAACMKEAQEKKEVKKVIEKKIINNSSGMELVEENDEDLIEDEIIDGEEVNIEIRKYMPSFKGGQEALMDYLVSEIKYPENCKKEGVEGKVLVSFTIDENGTVSDAEIAESVHPDLDKEALRVINAMPNWKAGTVNGKPEKMKLKLPIVYKMS